MTKLEQLENAVIAPAEYQAPSGEQEVIKFRLTRGHWLLFGLGLLCLLFIAFITIARSVQFTTVTTNLHKPDENLVQPAEVEIASMVKLPLGNRVLLLPGAHSVTASASGFETNTQTFNIAGERSQQFDIMLQPLPGKLEIDLEPSIVASVEIDGDIAGELPGVITDVAAGKRKITIDAALYRAFSTDLVVEGKDSTQTLEVTLDPAWAEVSVSSTPVGASILIDEQEVGVTPAVIKVEEGTRSLSVQADKFKPYQQEMVVTAQQNLSLPEITLMPADGELEIKTTPASAAVIVNGEYRGTSPIKLLLKPDEPQNLQIYKAGYRLVSDQVSLAPADVESKELSLQQDLVKVQVSVSPKDAEVFVDGVRRGRGSQSLSLNTLPHQISVRKAGYVSSQSRIIPTKGNRQIVSIQLLTKEQHFWANIPDSYNSSGGQSMKLFKSPGKVTMGSSRRESGRRSNESRYTAKLNKHFYVSLHEVTNKQFRAFKSSHSAGNYKKKSLDSGKHPAVNISWQQAAQYCNWLSKKEGFDPFYQTKSGYVSGYNADANGYRLPTEVEWSWLARNKGDEVLLYPWGSGPAPGTTKPVDNFADVNAHDLVAFTLANYDDGYKASSPIGRYPANHRGLYDMGGNVAEWTNDWYSAQGNLESGNKDLTDPLGPDIGEFHVVRGASWARGHLPQLRLAYRDYGAKGKHDIGFRVARYVVPPK